MTSANGSLTVVKAARLIDCTDGSSRENMAVVVENGRIARVTPQHDLAFPEGARPEVHDFGDATLLPGLIDCHTHTNMRGDGSSVDDVHEDDDDIHLIQGVMSARLAIESGVTTMRENGGWNRTTFSLKEGIRRGLVPGPRIVNCGRPITMTGGHCWMMGSQADGVDGVRKEVRRLVAEGADYIKVMSSGGSTRNSVPTRASYSLEELAAIVDEAHVRGRLVGAHAHAVQAIANCLDAGVDMIIHCTFSNPDGSISLEPALADRIAESGVWVNPTLWIIMLQIRHLEQKQESEGLNQEEETLLEASKYRVSRRLEVHRPLFESGARFIGGSDCGWGAYPFGQFHEELKALTTVGLSTKQALLAGTRDAAEAVGLPGSIGTLEAGKEADLLVVEGDPSRDLDDLTRVAAVFQAGQRVK